MSTEQNPLVSVYKDNEEIQVTSFYGGQNRGKCVQLTQDTGYVQLTEEQAQQLVKTLHKVYNVS